MTVFHRAEIVKRSNPVVENGRLPIRNITKSALIRQDGQLSSEKFSGN